MAAGASGGASSSGCSHAVMAASMAGARGCVAAMCARSNGQRSAVGWWTGVVWAIYGAARRVVVSWFRGFVVLRFCLQAETHIVCVEHTSYIGGRSSTSAQGWFGLFMVQRGVSWFRGFAVSWFCLQAGRHTVCVRHTGYIKMTAAHRRRRLSSQEIMTRPCNNPANRFDFKTTPSGGRVKIVNKAVKRFNFNHKSSGSGAKSSQAVLHATKSIA